MRRIDQFVAFGRVGEEALRKQFKGGKPRAELIKKRRDKREAPPIDARISSIKNDRKRINKTKAHDLRTKNKLEGNRRESISN